MWGNKRHTCLGYLFSSTQNWAGWMFQVSQTSIQSKELSSVLLSHRALHVLSPLDGRCKIWAMSSWGWCDCLSWLGSVLSDLQQVACLSTWFLSDLITWLSWGCGCPKWDSGVSYGSWIWLRWLCPLSLFVLPECCLWSGLRPRGWACSWDPGGSSWLWLWSRWFPQKFLRSCSSSESRDRPMSKCINRLSSHSCSFEKGGLKRSREQRFSMDIVIVLPRLHSTCNCSLTHSRLGRVRGSIQPNIKVFGLWEETGKHGGDMQPPLRKTEARIKPETFFFWGHDWFYSGFTLFWGWFLHKLYNK